VVLSFLIVVFSSALLLFYVQSICKKVLQREFRRPYCEKVLTAMHLEYPRLLAAFSPGASVDYSRAHLALKCDFIALSYLLKNGDDPHRLISRHERIMLFYFSFLLFCLPFRHTLHLREQEAVFKLSTMLQFFANLVGEKLTVTAFGSLLNGS